MNRHSTVTWQKNERGEGVVAQLPYSPDRPTIVFPSRNGYAPPENSAARIRIHQPQPGEVEEVLLVPSPDSKVLFAYPAALLVESLHGFHHIMVDGEPDVTLFAEMGHVVAWFENDAMHIVVTKK